ncbi:hypothetical protein LQZ19_08455 [Treponema primitia]|uniref:hypothetical protein n=1 Tax=Treponema primitia TaxID=88058 RepID=UPI0039810C85
MATIGDVRYYLDSGTLYAERELITPLAAAGQEYYFRDAGKLYRVASAAVNWGPGDVRYYLDLSEVTLGPGSSRAVSFIAEAERAGASSPVFTVRPDGLINAPPAVYRVSPGGFVEVVE